jgi:predicted DNA-binding antitoxin AbrB/MazE fold protein
VVQALRAVYEQGRLRFLEPVNLAEGQEIQVVILSERERVQSALENELVHYGAQPDDDVDEAALQAEIDAVMQGKPSVSDAIIDERREGP